MPPSSNKRQYFDPAKYSGPTNAFLTGDKDNDNDYDDDENEDDSDWDTLLATEANPSNRCDYCINTINLAKMRGLKRTDQSVQVVNDCLCQHWIDRSIDFLSSVEMSYAHDPVPVGFFKRISRAVSSFFRSVVEDIKAWSRRLKSNKPCDGSCRKPNKNLARAINYSPGDLVERESSSDEETSVEESVKKEDKKKKGGGVSCKGNNGSRCKTCCESVKDDVKRIGKSRKGSVRKAEVVHSKGLQSGLMESSVGGSERKRSGEGRVATAEGSSVECGGTGTASYSSVLSSSSSSSPLAEGTTTNRVDDDADDDEMEAYIDYEMRITTRSAFYEYPVPVTRYRKKRKPGISESTDAGSPDRGILEDTESVGDDVFHTAERPRRKISTFGFSYIDPMMFVEYPSLKGHMHKLVPRPPTPSKKWIREQRRASQPSFLTESFPQKQESSSSPSSSFSSSYSGRRRGSFPTHLVRESHHHRRRNGSVDQQASSSLDSSTGFYTRHSSRVGSDPSTVSSSSSSYPRVVTSPAPPRLPPLPLSSSLPTIPPLPPQTLSSSLPTIPPLSPQSSSLPPKSSSHPEAILQTEIPSPYFHSERFDSHYNQRRDDDDDDADSKPLLSSLAHSTKAKVITAACSDQVPKSVTGTTSNGREDQTHFDEVLPASSRKSCFNNTLSTAVSSRRRFTRPMSPLVTGDSINNNSSGIHDPTHHDSTSTVSTTPIASHNPSMETPSNNESHHCPTPSSSSPPSLAPSPSSPPPSSSSPSSPTSLNSFDFSYSFSPAPTSPEPFQTDDPAKSTSILNSTTSPPIWSWGASGCFDIVNNSTPLNHATPSQVSQHLNQALSLQIPGNDSDSDEFFSDAESETDTLIHHPSGRSSFSSCCSELGSGYDTRNPSLSEDVHVNIPTITVNDYPICDSCFQLHSSSTSLVENHHASRNPHLEYCTNSHSHSSMNNPSPSEHHRCSSRDILLCPNSQCITGNSSKSRHPIEHPTCSPNQTPHADTHYPSNPFTQLQCLSLPPNPPPTPPHNLPPSTPTTQQPPHLLLPLPHHHSDSCPNPHLSSESERHSTTPNNPHRHLECPPEVYLDALDDTEHVTIRAPGHSSNSSTNTASHSHNSTGLTVVYCKESPHAPTTACTHCVDTEIDRDACDDNTSHRNNNVGDNIDGGCDITINSGSRSIGDGVNVHYDGCVSDNNDDSGGGCSDSANGGCSDAGGGVFNDDFLVLDVEKVIVKDVQCGIRVVGSDGVSDRLKWEYPRFEPSHVGAGAGSTREEEYSVIGQDVENGTSSYQYGTLTKPQEGQSLISYLISQDFKTCANMEKENAHFHISEALIAAFESMQWNQTVKKNEADMRTAATSSSASRTSSGSSGSSSSSDEEIKELRQRIRIRRREKKMEKGHNYSSVSDDADDGTPQGLSPPGSVTPQGIGSEDDEEHKEFDVALSTADDNASGKGPGEITPTNLQAMASKGLNLSMASLYSETEIQKSNLQAQQKSISQQEEASLTAGSAESVAISLLKKFSEKNLPKASELKWLVSERDAPQRLLPLPASIPVSPDDADNTPTTAQTRLRGNLEWAPPRAQIIFSIHPSEKRSVVLARQNHRCAGCGTRLDPAFAKRYRYCEYLGKYFCQCCYGTETSIIPGRVIERWDFARYPISNFSFHLLEKMWAEPLFHMDNINPNLYKRVRGLEAIRDGRQQLIHLHALLVVCKRDTKLLNDIRGLPSHWIENDNVYSMEDFVFVKTGQMLTTIKALVNTARQHVAECQLCQGLGFICGMCKDNRVIFPFQLNKVVKCPVCQSCYHKHCFVAGKCPKCIRMEARRKQQQQPLSPMSPQSSPEWNGAKSTKKDDDKADTGGDDNNTLGDTPKKRVNEDDDDDDDTLTVIVQEQQQQQHYTSHVVGDKKAAPTDDKAVAADSDSDKDNAKEPPLQV